MNLSQKLNIPNTTLSMPCFIALLFMSSVTTWSCRSSIVPPSRSNSLEKEVKDPVATSCPKPDIKIQLAPGQQVNLQGNSQRKVKFTIIAGDQDLTLEELKGIKFAYDCDPNIPEIGLGVPENNQFYNPRTLTLEKLLKVNTLAANTSTTLTLIIIPGKNSKLTFTDIKLEGSADPDAHNITQIQWEQKVPKVKIELAKEQKPALQGEYSRLVVFEITAAEDLTLDDMQVVTFAYTPSPDTDVAFGLCNIRDHIYYNAQGYTLDKLLGLRVPLLGPKVLLKSNTPKKLTLKICPGNHTQVTFTDIKLIGTAGSDASENKVEKVKWEEKASQKKKKKKT